MKPLAFSQAIAMLLVLAGCGSTQRLASEQQLRQLRSIEVAVDVPASNFVYLQNGTYVYAQPPVGMAVAAGVAINVVANLVVAGIEYAMAATAREAMGPVGNSVQDVDLRATVFSQLKSVGTSRPGAPTLTLHTLPFPKSDVDPAQAANPGSTGMRPASVDPMQPLIDRAKASSADAMLFVRMVPLFRDANGRTAVQNTTWLYDKSGRLLSTWNVRLPGPTAPEMERADVVRWWADGRYRRFLAQGVRAVMMPVVEDLSRPELHTQREAEMQQTLERKAGAQPTDPLLRPTGGQVQESTANGMRMRSTACSVESDDKPVIYRYERLGQGTSLAVAAYCPGESLDLWTSTLSPGMSWLTEPLPAPTLVTATVK